LFIVSFVVVLAPGPMQAQDGAESDRTMSAVPVPGGLAAARAALGDSETAESAHLLQDVIRRSFQTPVGTKGLRRDAVLRPLLDHFDRVLKSSTQAETADVVPLPLTPAFWTTTVLGGRSAPETLLRDLLRSPVASLVYCALLAMDAGTREWVASNPSLLTNLTERQAAAFLLAAPGIRISGGTVRAPGGEAAASLWNALAGRAVTEPSDFVRALITAEGSLAWFYGSVALLTPAQQRFLLSLDGGHTGAHGTAGRKLLAIFERAALGWDIQERPFWRPSLDPSLLVSDLTVDATGTPRLPGTAAFWTLALGEDDPDRDRRAPAEGPRVDFAWLCEQIFTGGQAVVRGPYQQVLFASRRIDRLTPDNVVDAVIATRAVVKYAALSAVLERARIASIPIFAAAARRAAAIGRIDDEQRAAVTLAQFQGALALVARARARGTIGDRQAAELVSALSEIETDIRGDYGGQVVEWVIGAAAMAHPPRAGPQITNGDGDASARSLDADVLALVAGPPAPRNEIVEWEGTRYRVDLGSGEAARLHRLLGDSPALSFSAAAALATGAQVLESPGLTRSALAGQADAIEAALQAASCSSVERWHAEDLIARCREVLGVLTRAAKSGDTKNASRLTPRLRVLADSLLARGFLELTYAVALGQPDGGTILAADAASRHEFGFNLPGFGRLGVWRRPAAGADRVRDWHVTGSILGLDVALAPFSIVRLSTRPPSTRPTLNDEDRRLFIETVPLMNPADLKPADHKALVAAVRRGRERAAALRTARDAEAVAGQLHLAPARTTLFTWAVQRQPAGLHLSPSELLVLGLEPGATPGYLDSWGTPGEPRTGCLCLQMPTSSQADLLPGRWHTGVLATGFPDLNLRLAELLDDLGMPGTLLPSVLAAATWDFVVNVRSRDYDDRQALVDYVDALTRDRVELYLALLTTDGPLVPMLDGSGSRHGDGAR
jgi:hypothetical protein